MKKDLDEFSQTVQHETKSVVSNAAGALKEKLKIDSTESAANKVKRSVSTFLGTVSQALTPEKEENDDELCVIRNNEPVIMDRLHAQLYTLQNDPCTYLEDPIEKDYDEWIKKFDLESRNTELSDIMVTNVEVQELYTKLVPTSVSHIVFWHRYFYKINRLLLAEERKRVIVERANQPTGTEDVVWDDIDDDFTVNKELPDHITDQLLADYEKECKGRRRTASNDIPPVSPISNSQLLKQSAAGDDADLQVGGGDAHAPTSSINVSTASIERTKDADSNVRELPESEPITSKGEGEGGCAADLCLPDTEQSVELQQDMLSSAVLVSKDDSGLSLSCSESNESAAADPLLVTREKGDLVVVGAGCSNRTSPASSNREGSNDDEWEKDFELEAAEEERKLKGPSPKPKNSDRSPSEGDEEWEQWE